MTLLPTWFTLSWAAIFGLVIGSFLNVVIYRIPARRTLMGRSHCPRCDTQIRALDNIPVLSWLILRGRCRNCHQPISVRYPLVEAANALAWVGLTAWLGIESPILPLYLILASISITLTMIDFDTLTLPNRITYPTFLLTLGYLAVVSFMDPLAKWQSLVPYDQWAQLKSALIGAAIYFVFFFAMWFLTKGRGLGFGDVKLAPTLGLMIGWFSVGATAVGIAAAFIVGAIPAAILMWTGAIKKGTAVPFGPMLIAGAWVATIWGAPLWNAYATISRLN